MNFCMGKSKGKWILDIFDMSKNEKGLKTFGKNATRA